MTIRRIDNTNIASVHSDDVIIKDASSALDCIAEICYKTNCDCMVLNKAAVAEQFFNLRSGIAGEILERFVTYNIRLAIVGDFSSYTSKSLCDFIRESNRGHHIFFMPTEQDAVAKLSIL